jgi:N-methylhydantoinase B
MWIAVGVGGGESGPWGATRAGDADSFSKFYQANSIDTAVEASEADSPIVILRREYVTDTGGAGFNRGGAGVLKDTLYLEAARHSVITLRFKQPSGRGRGGRDGPTGVWLWKDEPGTPPALRNTDRASYRAAIRIAGRLDRSSGAPAPDGDYYWFGRERSWPTGPGAVWRYLTNGGGGWGDPLTRDPERVKRDVRDGYVSIEGSARDYGVVVTGDPAADPEARHRRNGDAGLRQKRQVRLVRRPLRRY